jgi:DNA-binding MarR family transcriptional regulator
LEFLVLDVFSLDELLRNAAAAQRLRLERALRPFDLSPAQFEVLRQLKIRDNSSGAELARACALSAQTIGVVVENLEKKALVRRSADPTNLRIQRVRLHVAGEQALELARGHAAEAIGPPLLAAVGARRAEVARFLTEVAGSGR